jgi:endoglucanase
MDRGCVTRRSRSRIFVTLGLLMVGAVLSACGAGQAAAPVNPLRGASFYVNPAGNAVRAVEQLRREGETERAEVLQQRIASRPSATWLTPDPGAVFSETQTLTKAAVAADSIPVLVAYNIPGRDCGLYSSGGAAGIDDYLGWVGSLAAGIEDRRAVVVLEPDAVTHSLDGCLAEDQVAQRRSMLAEAVTILKRQPNVHVYLDAGNASWVEDMEALAAALRESGIEDADGFALNVSNFETKERSVVYGRELSSLLDDAHFVIDTSRNGAGAPVLEAGSASSNWCNPPGRRLGAPPTAQTGEPRVDALLWIKQPGDSDGDCGTGAPDAGSWWPSYADELMGTTTP